METKKYQDNRQPDIKTEVITSKDGKWIMHRTVITSIYAVNFYDKVIESAKEKQNEVKNAFVDDKKAD